MSFDLVLIAGSALVGAALALPRVFARIAPGRAAWIDALLLFFLASAVCDGVAALGLGGSAHLNPYAVAVGFLLVASLPRKRVSAAAG